MFVPYSYILHPGILRAQGINLRGLVVVLDEANNVEDTLCASVLGTFGEIDLCKIL